MARIEPGDRVKVVTDKKEFFGVLMPSATDFVVIKLDSGYNVGLAPDCAKTTLVEKGVSQAERRLPRVVRPDLPQVSIISTGGTIASKIDYRTGAVTSQFNADDIIDAIPALAEIANIDGTLLYNILSENMQPESWSELARTVYNQVRSGADGVLVTHGTDTLGYSAAALSFMLKVPVPVVFVGSQRSADRPSSDNVVNATCAAVAATSDLAGVFVVMHEGPSDDTCLMHRGSRTKKMHTSRRDAFRSVNASPIARVSYADRSLQFLSDHANRGGCELAVRPRIEPKCALVKFFPGATASVVDYYVAEGYKGLVIEGTGLGHVASDWVPHIKEAADAIPVVMTSQCVYGRVCDRVYDTGRDLLAAGAIEGDDMLSETALVKLMWVLGQTSDYAEIVALLKTDLAGEISTDPTRMLSTFEALP
ncbi:MAG TPA: Glu-tRNA(Gln) amidotransferase subunit GatD [Candidatus Bathyarchaeia archaeon]|nr:Glu-tRNA(Gln) amidotransferase subunit GatD [Candidatus Bathyarchaeia archaeon]